MLQHLRVFFRHRTSRAIGAVFAASGSIFGTWAAIIPLVKDKFMLDEAQLGVLLLFLPLGVTLMNPFSVPLLHRFGVVRLTLGSLATSVTLFGLPLLMPAVWLTGIALFLAGAAFSVLNVSMNTCASQIEQVEKSRILAGCHGLWSAGAWLGATFASIGCGLENLSWLSAGIFLVVSLTKSLSDAPDAPATQNDAPAPLKASKLMPNAALWVLIIISLCTNFTEGAMNDWSAVYLRDELGVLPNVAAWGFSAYAFFMALGRFLGDGWIARWGNRICLQAGGILAASGFVVVILVPNFWVALLGFSMVGAGVSLGAPILYGAAARVEGMPKGAGLAMMNTFAMVGFLAGPAVIGFIAKIFSLPVAFGVVAVAISIWVWKSKSI